MDALEPVVMLNLLPAVPRTRLPFVAVMAPEVAVRVVAAVTEPGALNVEGTDKVTVDPEAAVVISLEVPAILMLPAEGIAVPVSPVNVDNSTAPPPMPVHVADCAPLLTVNDVNW